MGKGHWSTGTASPYIQWNDAPLEIKTKHVRIKNRTPNLLFRRQRRYH